MAAQGLSRRRLTLMAAASVSASAGASAQAAGTRPTAGKIADHIRLASGGAWHGGPLEGLVLGDPTTPVRGVGVAAIPTIAVLEAAARQRLDLIVALEGPLYARPFDGDPQSPGGRTQAGLGADPVYRGKAALAARRQMSVLRLNETWRARSPDPLASALASKLGWRRDGDTGFYGFSETTLRTVIAQVAAVTGARGGLRYVGDPEQRLRTALVAPGAAEVVATVRGLRGADLLLTGDLREWEVVEYVFDSQHGGTPKALIATGRMLSEQAGLDACVAWLRGLLPGLPVRALTQPDPYWRLPA